MSEDIGREGGGDLMSGAFWGETDNLSFIEEKHKTGYCLEVMESKTHQVIDKITVPQAEDLAEHLKLWAETMREGGHYKEEEKGKKRLPRFVLTGDNVFDVMADWGTVLDEQNINIDSKNEK